jgi:hypothetical protein
VKLVECLSKIRLEHYKTVLEELDLTDPEKYEQLEFFQLHERKAVRTGKGLIRKSKQEELLNFLLNFEHQDFFSFGLSFARRTSFNTVIFLTFFLQ